jgi:hypothetical protein
MKDKHFVIWLKGFVTACHSHLPTPAQWDQLVEKLNTVKSEGDKQTQDDCLAPTLASYYYSTNTNQIAKSKKILHD